MGSEADWGFDAVRGGCGQQTTETKSAQHDAVTIRINGEENVQLAGLRSTGRHGDGVWVLSLWCFASRTWKWAVMFFAVHRMGQVRKIVSERAALP
jgi:hypothetical protein